MNFVYNAISEQLDELYATTEEDIRDAFEAVVEKALELGMSEGQIEKLFQRSLS